MGCLLSAIGFCSFYSFLLITSQQTLQLPDVGGRFGDALFNLSSLPHLHSLDLRALSKYPLYYQNKF